MKLRKLISGGQTGADQQGLIEGRRLGLATGGWVPKGWRTEDGPAPWLAEFGCREHALSSYAPRTEANVRDADITLWFGNIGSPGYLCTQRAARKYYKQFIDNPTHTLVQSLAESWESFNVAGNRLSKNPGVVKLVRDAFAGLNGE